MSTDTLVNPSIVDEGILVTKPVTAEQSHLLSPGALRFVADLARAFGSRRYELLKLRDIRQKEIDAGRFPDFLAETACIRQCDWTVRAAPPDLRDRRVEITGPVDRRIMIDALNSGARVFTADFEDSSAPTWHNCVQGQVNLYDAVRRTITHTGPDGRPCGLATRTATLMVRPRGWHLTEKHVRVDGEAVPAALFDFGLFCYHNAHELIRRGSGPYYCLPKLESHLEARLWDDVFIRAQETLGIPVGTIRATVLIETVLAAFEMDEILYELRDHSAGLNCGQWDYVFSFIKRFRRHPEFVLPERTRITMERPFLLAFTELLVKTCHRRGAHAMGGIAAQIPIEDDETANRAAIKKVREDKLREVEAGHDGTWVAHPALVRVAEEAFTSYTKAPNQIGRQRRDVDVSAADLLSVPAGPITESGLRTNIRVGIRYLEAWLGGQGFVPLNHLMEDAATAEISRAQVWQWVRHSAKLDDGRAVDRALVAAITAEELARIRDELGADAYQASQFAVASKIFAEMMLSDDFVEFMPSLAYDYL